jgi:hypothetical protein
VLGILLPGALGVVMLDVLPVVAQEENRTGQNPATVRKRKDIEFMFSVFIGMPATAMGQGMLYR